jgi:choline dehydrogenase-like flavoprotein
MQYRTRSPNRPERRGTDSATDASRSVQGHPWLRVADSSLCPDSIEINPYPTIMSLADRVADGVIADLSEETSKG